MSPNSPKPGSSAASTIDFTTLSTLHSLFLSTLASGLLLSSAPLSNALRSLVDTCESFVARVDRWGGDVLPELLSGSTSNRGDGLRGTPPRTTSHLLRSSHLFFFSFLFRCQVVRQRQEEVRNVDNVRPVDIICPPRAHYSVLTRCVYPSFYNSPFSRSSQSFSTSSHPRRSRKRLRHRATGRRRWPVHSP
jgi:hypothetical protein